MTPFRAGPHCPDHPAHDARYCPECWREINQGLRPDTCIGKHYEAAHKAASVVSGGKA